MNNNNKIRIIVLSEVPGGARVRKNSLKDARSQSGSKTYHDLKQAEIAKTNRGCRWKVYGGKW